MLAWDRGRFMHQRSGERLFVREAGELFKMRQDRVLDDLFK